MPELAIIEGMVAERVEDDFTVHNLNAQNPLPGNSALQADESFKGCYTIVRL